MFTEILANKNPPLGGFLLCVCAYRALLHLPWACQWQILRNERISQEPLKDSVPAEERKI